MPELKELYKCTTLDDLKKISELPKHTVNAKGLTQSYNKAYDKAKRLYDEAVLKENEGDEELAFIFLFRCAEIVQKLPKCADVKTVSVKCKANGRALFDNCLKRMENIESSLTRRYHFRQEKEEAEKMESAAKRALLSDAKPSYDKGKRSEHIVEGDEITPEQLHALIQSDERPEILLMDVREEPAPVISINAVNFQVVLIDPMILETAKTAKKLEASLPLMEKGLYRKRHSMDYVIIMDECGDRTALASRSLSGLRLLYNAITEYDQDGVLRRPPLILRGGIQNWKLHYPMFVAKETNELADISSDDSGYTSSFISSDYPDLKSYFAQKPEPVEITDDLEPEPSRFQEPKPFSESSYPRFDKSEQRSVPSIPSRQLKPQSYGNFSSNLVPAEPTEDFSSHKLASSASLTEESIAHPNNDGEVGSDFLSSTTKPSRSLPAFDRTLKPKKVTGIDDSQTFFVNQETKSEDSTNNEMNSADSFSGEQIQQKFDSAVSGHIKNGERLDLIENKLKESRIFVEGSSEPSEESQSAIGQEDMDQKSGGLETFAQPIGKRDPAPRNTRNLKNRTEVPPDVMPGLESFAQPKVADQGSGDKSTTPSSKPLIPDRSKKPTQNDRVENESMMPVVDDSKEFANHVTLMRRESALGKTEPGLTGLYNLGNTCYMNSIIQCISSTAPLRQYFMSRRYVAHINRQNRFGTKGKLTTSFAALLYELNSQRFRAIRPRSFRDTVLQNTRLFRLGKQEDSQEFLSFLLEGLHEDLNLVRQRIPLPEQNNTGADLVREGSIAWRNQLKFSNSFIQQRFGGQLVSTVRCKSCDARSYTFDSFNQVHLELPTSKVQTSLRECLEMHMRRETLSGDAKWNCPKCRCPRDAEKKIDFWKLPELLIIHLKRFESQVHYQRKIDLYVDFPLRNLCLETFVHPASMTSTDYVKRSYELYAVSNHYGEMGGGHYTAQCYKEQLNRWFNYDDESVSSTTQSRVQSDKAYILFYRSAGQDVNMQNQGVSGRVACT